MLQIACQHHASIWGPTDHWSQCVTPLTIGSKSSEGDDFG